MWCEMSFLLAVVNPILGLLKAVAAQDVRVFEDYVNSIPPVQLLSKFNPMARMVPIHGRAFEMGIISVEALVEIMTEPFLEVARAFNSTNCTGPVSQLASPARSAHQDMMREMVLKTWADRIRNLLNADMVSN